ncbi:hypothetical protein GPALN_006945 [Globodera pallida]|nr:hypothetical protein GPALN_006945 [Globodera pallida]
MKMIILSSFVLLNVLVTLLGIANGAGTSPDKQKNASGKQPMEVDGAVQEKLNVNECGICLEEIETGEIQPRALPCDHVFHQSCIQRWLTKNNTCPKCRYQIPNEADIQYLNRNLGESQNINNMEINDGNFVRRISYRDLNIHDLERTNGRIVINGHPISNEAWASVNNYWQMANERIQNETIANARRIRDEGLENARRVLNEALATTRRDEASAATRRDEASAATRGDEASAAARRDKALQLRDEMKHRQWRDEMNRQWRDEMNHRQWRDEMNHRQLRNEMKHRQLRDEMKARQLRDEMKPRQLRDEMKPRQLRDEMKPRQLRDEMKHRQLRDVSEMKSKCIHE